MLGGKPSHSSIVSVGLLVGTTEGAGLVIGEIVGIGLSRDAAGEVSLPLLATAPPIPPAMAATTKTAAIP